MTPAEWKEIAKALWSEYDNVGGDAIADRSVVGTLLRFANVADHMAEWTEKEK